MRDEEDWGFALLLIVIAVVVLIGAAAWMAAT